MQLTNPYFWFKEAIDPETCKKIIDLGLTKLQDYESKGISTEAYTVGNNEKSSMPDSSPQGELSKQQLKLAGVENTYVRDSNVAWLNDSWLYDIFHPLINQANREAGWNWQWDYSENFQFTVYKPGQFYSWHKDGGSDQFSTYKRYIYGVTPLSVGKNDQMPSGYSTDPKMIGKIRKISMTVNLNAPGEYEGGNLKFDFGQHSETAQFHECEEIRPQGSVIVFPSFIDHCVTPVTSGTRYSLVLWALGNPFK